MGWAAAVRAGTVGVGIRAGSIVIRARVVAIIIWITQAEVIRISIIVGVIAVVWITPTKAKVSVWPIVAAAIIPGMPAVVVPTVVSAGTSNVVATRISTAAGMSATAMLGVSRNRQNR